MKNRSVVPFVLAGSIAFSAVSFADMIEIKNRGFFNGKILSQDSNEVRFEDSKKNLLVVPKSDVLFLEEQKDAPAVALRPKGVSWRDRLWRWQGKATRIYRDSKRKVLKKVEWLMSLINAPLDRSGVEGKADELADSMNSLANSLGKMAKNDKKRAEGIKMLTSGWTEYHDESKTGRKYKEVDGGNFNSLD